MNQKGFAKIILVIVVIIALGIVGYFAFIKQHSQQPIIQNENLSTYNSKELGVSFKYPSDLKVYQQDENNVLIKADYKNLEHSLVSIHMGVSKSNSSQLATKESIDSVLKLLGQKTVDLGAKGNYRILKVEGGPQYYFLSSKGTFIVSDKMDSFSWKDIFQKEGIYQTYRSKFDAIRDFIIIE